MCFYLVPISMTLADLERPLCTITVKLINYNQNLFHTLTILTSVRSFHEKIENIISSSGSWHGK